MEKVALVTGSSSGIGLETALALARDGYKTFASMRNTKMRQGCKMPPKDGLPINIIRMDVTDEESVVSAVRPSRTTARESTCW